MELTYEKLKHKLHIFSSFTLNIITLNTPVAETSALK